MGEIFIKTVIAIAVLLLFIVPGFALKKAGLVSSSSKRSLSSILLYVCQPALTINSFCVFTPEEWSVITEVGFVPLLKNFAVAAALSLAALLAVFALCKIVLAKYRDRDAAGIYTYVAVFS